MDFDTSQRWSNEDIGGLRCPKLLKYCRSRFGSIFTRCRIYTLEVLTHLLNVYLILQIYFQTVLNFRSIRVL